MTMKVIVFTATKGGVGKSTLCFNVALEAAKEHQVLLADLDPQQTLKSMWTRRAEMLNPRLVTNLRGGIANGVALLREAGYSHEFMIIDTPGSDMEMIEDAISAADAIVLPTGPSPLDWIAQEAVADLVDSKGLMGRALFVVNRAGDRVKEGEKPGMVEKTEAFFRLRTRNPMPVIKHRDVYAKAAETGKAGIETSHAARAEIAALWAAIKAIARTTHAEKEAGHVRQIH
jgi:chromosome partitioning protein